MDNDFALNNQILNFLESSVGVEKYTPGLERLKPYLSSIANEINKRDIKVVTIGGTNGKGETAYSLGEIFKQQNIEYALWSSPHVLLINERIQSLKGKIELTELFKLSKDLHGEMEEKDLTFYEFLLVIFFRFAISIKKIKVIVLEVGLGGRFDGVNIVDPNLTVIVSISRDHQEILGESYKKILLEKLGITRTGVPLITSLELGFCRNIVNNYVEEIGIPWRDLFNEQKMTRSTSINTRNQTLAQEIFKELFHQEVKVNKFPSFIGRGQELNVNKTNFLFVGAHNPEGIRRLMCESVFKKDDDILFSLSKRSPKDVITIGKILDGAKARVLSCDFTHNKSIKTLKNFFGENSNIQYISEWKDYIIKTVQENEKKRIVIIGSYYFVGVVQEFIVKQWKMTSV